MRTHLTAAFADELIKVAALPGSGLVQRALMSIRRSGVTDALQELAHGLRTSPVHRRAVLSGATHGALLGGLQEGAFGEGDPFLKRTIKGMIAGGVGGGVTGAAFPGWFHRSSHVAHP